MSISLPTSSSGAAQSATNFKTPYQVLQETENSGADQTAKSTALLAHSILFTQTYREQRDSIWMDTVDSSGKIRQDIPIFTYIKAIPSQSSKASAIIAAMQANFKEFFTISHLLEHRETLGLDELSCIQITMEKARKTGFFSIYDLHVFSKFILDFFQRKEVLSEKTKANEYIQLFLSAYNLLQSNPPEKYTNKDLHTLDYLRCWKLPNILLEYLDPSSAEVFLVEMKKNLLSNPDSTKKLTLELLKEITGQVRAHYSSLLWVPPPPPVFHRIQLAKELCFLIKEDKDTLQYLPEIACGYISLHEFAVAETLIRQAQALRVEENAELRIANYLAVKTKRDRNSFFHLPFLPPSESRENEFISCIKDERVLVRFFGILHSEKSDKRDELLLKEENKYLLLFNNCEVLFNNPQRKEESLKEAREAIAKYEAAKASASATTSSSAAANSN